MQTRNAIDILARKIARAIARELELSVLDTEKVYAILQRMLR